MLVYFIRNNSVPILGTDIRQAWLVFGCLEFKAAQRFSNTIQKRTGDFENSKINILACLEEKEYISEHYIISKTELRQNNVLGFLVDYIILFTVFSI